ncbi:hypothetical protein DPMN_088173 [Dreissena polymorpha]|uniref:Uncharacterized protein n=1 Tax=Dreissena polymorpha TaxID=45954 RepID=A0A9D4KUJ7_DREPO|nr:hypothetical protein DPMN_088173 [Dreissena polymorpha]
MSIDKEVSSLSLDIKKSHPFSKTWRNLTPVNRNGEISSLSIDMEKSHPIHRH